jgi:hypothetical protein
MTFRRLVIAAGQRAPSPGQNWQRLTNRSSYDQTLPTRCAGLFAVDCSATALAVPVVVTGYDATANKVVVPGNAPAVARASFESTLSGIGAPLLREDMEGMTVPGALANQSPIAFSFGSITGSAITPSNEALSLPPQACSIPRPAGRSSSMQWAS